MGFLNGKRALIFGVASPRSIAWGIANAMHVHLAFACTPESGDRPLGPVTATGVEGATPLPYVPVEGAAIAFPEASGILTEDTDGGVWIRTASGLARWSGDGLERFSEDAIGVRDPRAASVDGAGNVWVTGTDPEAPEERDHLARFDGSDWTSYALNDLQPEERVVAGTPDPDAGMWYVVWDVEADLYRLLRVAGEGGRRE